MIVRISTRRIVNITEQTVITWLRVSIPFNKHGSYRICCFWLYLRNSYIAVIATVWFVVTIYFSPGSPAHLITLLLQLLPLTVHMSIKNINELDSCHRGVRLHCVLFKTEDVIVWILTWVERQCNRLVISHLVLEIVFLYFWTSAEWILTLMWMAALTTDLSAITFAFCQFLFNV